ncbi:DUF1013 domain-containing protein [Parapedomonas caeni]
MAQPLMPHATAVWLVENTALTFQQIADFCGLHVLEVQAIADETASTRYIPRDPIRAGELTEAEIERGQKDPAVRLQMSDVPEQQKRTKGPRYTPVSKRQDKPDGVAWLLRYHPELSDGQISKLIGTTKSTIAAIRDRSHWNIQNIKTQDPVALGLCSQRELDALVQKAAKKRGETPEPVALDEESASLIEELKRERAQREAAGDAEDDSAA